MRLPYPVALAVFALSASAIAAQPASVEQGRELFTRTWVAWDSRVAEGGDGLGPMYNATSCAACHNQGALGGGGGRERNVRLVRPSGLDAFLVDHRLSTLSQKPLAASAGTRVERNTPALFGAGLIDSIPDAELHVLAAGQSGPISGRVSETADGRAGRFGWKGHTASLADFVRTACANELGLAVDGVRQGQPLSTDLMDRLVLMQAAVRQQGKKVDLVGGPRRDLSERDVAALTAFVGALPAPKELASQPGRHDGRELFGKAGCDGCHVQKVAAVDGIYADLLLHDMGRGLADAGSSYQTKGNDKLVARADSDGLLTRQLSDGSTVKVPADVELTPPPSDVEWRTPPLWGVRDSAPYLHDGRAATLDDAIRAHGGEAMTSAGAYAALTLEEQQRLVGFLESLVAPG